MASPTVLSAIVGAVAGAASAAVAIFALSPNEGAGPTGASLALTDNPALESYQSLQQRANAFEDRLSQLESERSLAGPSATRRAVVPEGEEPEPQDLAALRKEIESLKGMAGLRSGAAPTASFVDMVAQANEELEELERAERAAERQEREAERIEERLTSLTTDLGLDTYQVGKMRETMTSTSAAMTELWTNRDDGMGRDERREAMGEIREQSQAAMASFLTPTQLEQYNESNNDRNFFGRGGGGRGGGGR